MVMVGTTVPESVMDATSTAAQERTVFYVVFGKDRPGLFMNRPPNIAVGYHTDLLPIVVTVLGLNEAHKVNKLNKKIISNIQDPSSEDPSSLITLIFPSKKLKIYAVKVGVITGIWYGVEWNTGIAPLIKHPKSEFKKCDTFLQAIEWMLTTKTSGSSSKTSWILTTHPLPHAPSPVGNSTPDPFGEFISRMGSPIKEYREQGRTTSPVKQYPARGSYDASHIRFATSSTSISSAHGMRHPQGQLRPCALNDLDVVEISDDEAQVELPHVPSADMLQRLVLRPVIDHDSALLMGDAAVDLGKKAEASLLGRRMPSAHRTLILRAYVHTMTTDQFTILISCAPRGISPEDATKLWGYIA
ncbi:hypothetical protein LXA43DRAFT_1064055 [Ganoderma leucocontextum]|nr:hypothetical protein LXA43DRAFT_1064055 [Ganoderma leucocontextum]